MARPIDIRTWFDPLEIEERHMKHLPCLASDLIGLPPPERSSRGDTGPIELIPGWTPTLCTLLKGTRDSKSPLQILRGHESSILRHVHSFIVWQYAKHVLLTIPASCVGHLNNGDVIKFTYGRRSWSYGQELLESFPNSSRGGFSSMTHAASTSPPDEQEEHDRMRDLGHTFSSHVAFSLCGKVQFPPPADRKCNMMPFIFGKKESLPEQFQPYFELIEACPYNKGQGAQDETGEVGYLTVHESFVRAGDTQRRQGLHIETPGHAANSFAFTPGIEHWWGMGTFFGEDEYEGGIYMASNIEATSVVWDALVDKKIKGIVDAHGGCEHLRPLLGPGEPIPENTLVWMTDATPHEALPQTQDGYRQFFRIVTSHITHWFAQHSTPNPFVPVPDGIVIVQESKFKMNS